MNWRTIGIHRYRLGRWYNGIGHQPVQAQRALDYAYNNVEQAATYLMEGGSSTGPVHFSVETSHKAFIKPQADP